MSAISSIATSDRYKTWPVFWFARLERAIACGDFTIAAEAQRELERLGVIVRYARNPSADRAMSTRDLAGGLPSADAKNGRGPRPQAPANHSLQRRRQ